MQEEKKAALIEAYKSAKRSLMDGLKTLLERILKDAAENGTETIIICFADDCSRYGTNDSDVITHGFDYLETSDFEVMMSEAGRLRRGNVVYTISNDGGFTKCPVDPEKDYRPMFLVGWPE
jgi:hypothetical protein